jgi:hypothetical protein
MGTSSRAGGRGRAVMIVAGSALALTVGMVAAPTAHAGLSGRAGASAQASQAQAAGQQSCVLGGDGRITHVIYVQFDNVHYTRDNPNVASDLEQMPNLLSFITGNGTLISHEHTPLIAHTADDIITSETGLYGNHQGMPIANEYNYYTSSGPASSTDTAGSFGYWTDPIVDYSTSTGAPVGDTTTTLLGQNGKTPPAPWVSYTRAGCDFGSVAAANTELENQTPDVPLVFGANSWEAKEAENPDLADKAEADFMGLSVHCAASSATCSRGVTDSLPDEPGGYHGYKALFGNYFIQPVISPSGPVRDLNGNVIEDSSGDIGFPGYDGMTGPNALAYTLDMQTHGIPVTYTYLSDVHDSWTTGAGLGPGTATYEQQLAMENAAFGQFFAGLAAHGITKSNTLFVFTADEGDHFVGGPASPSGCNGVTVICTYQRVGEVDGNLTGLLAAKSIPASYDVAADSAPIVYVNGQPGRTDAGVRALSRAAATLTGSDLATGKTVRLINYMADPVEMNILHMITGDPKRTASVALFGNPDFWLSSGSADCGTSCFSEPSGQDAWNHGDVAPEINTTWLGLAGPGVRHSGVDAATWSDHTDIEPTMMALLGLRSDYTPDGRVLVEVMSGERPSTQFVTLGDVYSQLNAAVGSFGLNTLKASTMALTGDEATYNRIENSLTKLGSARDALVAKMQAILLGGQRYDRSDASALIAAGEHLLNKAAGLAS